MRLTATGDALITRRMPLYDDPAFMGMIELIRGCDVAFTNTRGDAVALPRLAGRGERRHGALHRPALRPGPATDGL